jgi:predicted aldo/keto reductase-like oxidoreductase
MNYYHVYGLKEYIRQTCADLGAKTTEWVKGLKAELCVQCGECEDKCPQHISIIDQLEEVTRILGGAK